MSLNRFDVPFTPDYAKAKVGAGNGGGKAVKIEGRGLQLRETVGEKETKVIT